MSSLRTYSLSIVASSGGYGAASGNLARMSLRKKPQSEELRSLFEQWIFEF